ncbi:hypothetical protein V2S66_10415 [Streptomyces sp. V4-01]|uniref:Uncharacterized protein n=1 Tax=Actinacidiphila polyblastidii TaxID=3110430 RepID=A0ABU7P987_9ACTN|nr:hypothetical protein [Streptomyces sp. V4-01]
MSVALPAPAAARAAAAAVVRAARAAAPGERAAYAVGTALTASGLFHLGVFLVAGGPWDGPVSWRKPFTFGVSFGLTLIALTWVTSYVAMGARARTLLLALFTADCAVEVAGITVQAWRRRPSHFDMETPADSAVAMVLAAGGGLLVVVLTVFAVAAFRRRPSGPAGMPLAVRAGFALLLVGLLSGAAMIARGVVDTRTGRQQAAYHSTGALKPLHAVSLHAVLVLPVLAWLLSRTARPAAARRRIVLAGVLLYAAAAVAALGWGAATA